MSLDRMWEDRWLTQYVKDQGSLLDHENLVLLFELARGLLIDNLMVLSHAGTCLLQRIRSIARRAPEHSWMHQRFSNH